MSSSLVRTIVAATALSVVPAIAGAQAPQTKACKDGSTSTRSTFACWGHGGVDTTRATERPHAAEVKHHEAEPVQAGTPRVKHTKSTAHKASKATAHKTAKAQAHHAKAEKQDEGRRGWLPWRHKKAEKHDAKKKKHKSSSHAPITERPNGQPRQN